MSNLKQIQLDILEQIEKVCKNNKINYFLVAGTCIGAVRHKGFIPWDDDIDVGMLYEDYQKFISVSNEFQYPYFLQTPETDKNYRLQIARVRNSETTLVECSEKDRDINHGVFVDIYPLYNTPKNGVGRKWLLFISQVRRLFLFGEPPKKRGKVARLCAKMLLLATPLKMQKKLLVKTNKIMSSRKITDCVSFFYGNHIDVIYPRDWFLPVEFTLFEGKMLPIPHDADKYLTKSFGDYMKLPPIEERVIHHDYLFIDCETGYEKYKGYHYCKK